MKANDRDDRLSAALQQVVPAASSGARDRAVSAVGDQTVARHLGASSRRLPRLAAVAGMLILLIALVSLTPPGRAVARALAT